MMKSSKKACIIGTGRSGTTFTAKALSKGGREVGHETMGKDGIVSWCLVADGADSLYGPPWSALSDFDLVVGHQLRHPLDSIMSLMTIHSNSRAFIERSGLGDFRHQKKLLGWCMVHWLSWNQFAYEKAEFHWTLDNVETGILPMFDALEWGIDDAEWKRMCQLTSNTRNAAKARLEWKRIHRTPPRVFARRLQHAYFPVEKSWQSLADIDETLTQEIKSFYDTFRCLTKS